MGWKAGAPSEEAAFEWDPAAVGGLRNAYLSWYSCNFWSSSQLNNETLEGSREKGAVLHHEGAGRAEGLTQRLA